MRARFEDAREESARRISETMAGAESQANLRLEPEAARSGSTAATLVESAATLADPFPGPRPRRAAIAIVAIVAIATGGALAWLGDGAASEGPAIAAPPPQDSSTVGPGPAPVAAPIEPALAAPVAAGPDVPTGASGADRAEEETTRAPERESEPRERAGTRRRTRRWDWE